MRLVSYGEERGNEEPGVLTEDDHVVPLRAFITEAVEGPYRGMKTLLENLPELRARIDELVAAAPNAIPLADVRLGPPVTRPGVVVAVGANYAEHIREVPDLASTLPVQPVVFVKPGASVVGANDAIIKPLETEKLDYECELAVVIGRSGRRIHEKDAMDHVVGYMIANDVTAREVMVGEMHKSPAYMQTLRGKGYDTFCPTGPWLLTADSAPAEFRLRTWVNDELRQDGTSEQMLFGVAKLIASISEFMTLNTGDVILTGTPAGPGIARTPQVFLDEGDVVSMEISGLGRMCSVIHDEI